MKFVLELTGRDKEKYDEALTSVIKMLLEIKGLGFKLERLDMNEE